MKNVKNCFKILLFFVISVALVLTLSSCFCVHEWEDNEILKEATCLETGRANSTCKLCGVTRERVLPKGEHQGKVVVASTCTEDGYTVIDCPVCGYYEKGTIVPARGHKTEGGKIFCSRCDIVTGCENYFQKLAEWKEQDAFHFRLNSLPVNESVYIIEMELLLSLDEEGILVGEGTAMLKGGEEGVDVEVYIYDDTLYLYNKGTEGYYVVPLFVIFENFALSAPDAPADGTTMPDMSAVSVPMEEVVAFLEKEIAPLLRAGEKLSEGEVELMLSHVISSLFDVTIYQGYNFHLSADRLKDLNERLSEETVAYFVDKEFGKGTFDYIEALVIGNLSRTLGETLTTLVVEGVTAGAVVEKLDALAVLLTGDEEATISALIGSATEQENFDLLALLQDEQLMSKTLADLIAESAEEPTTGEELLADAEEGFAEMREKTFYSLVGITKENVKATKEAYDAQIDAILDMFSLSFQGSETGELISFSIGLPMGGSVPTRLTWLLGECEAPDVGDVPERIRAMLDALKVENGTKVEKEVKTQGGVNTVRKSKIEFVSEEDGTVTFIRSYVSVITFEFSGETEEVIYNGTTQTAWLYDAVEEIYVFDFPMEDAQEMQLREECCGWVAYSFYKTMPVQYTKNTFVISWIGADYVYGDVLTSETMEAPANNVVGFWYNKNTGEVRFDGDWETHEYVYENTVTGATCREESYELWGCPDCDKEEKRNLSHGPHEPMDNRPYCNLCHSLTYNPDDALYIYDSASDETYVELFDGGEAVGYVKVDGAYKMYDLSWKEENGTVILYFFWNNQTVLTLNLVGGELVAPV
ncbi:MAG: hypothetical protein IKC72_05955 [Clostridia bacterium]|nr:hypothetical protein [Clostridia bacterium]